MTLSRRTGLIAGLLSIGLAMTPALAAGPTAGDPQRPSGEYDEKHLLVAFDPGAPAAERRDAHASQRAEVKNTIANLNLDVVELREGDDPVEVAARYERIPAVAYTDFNHEITFSSSDTLFLDQWGLDNTGQPVTGSLVDGSSDVDVDAPEGWAAAYGATIPDTGGTTVGIIDTGIDLGHVDLINKTVLCANATGAIGLVVSGSCSDDNLHGTHVAGTIGARTDNGVGVAGVAPDAQFAVVKALNAAGSGFYADIVASIDYLSTRGVPIISMSIGGPQDDALDKVLTDAYARGTLLIAAAGNDYDDTKNWPAYHRDVMSVASVNAAGAVSDFSTCNSDVEIIAPGEDIWSTFPGNSYGVISGTSMATPHVSGVAALLMSEQGLTASQTRSALKSTAGTSISCRGFATVGLVNLANALGSGGGGGGTTEPEPVGTGTIAGTVTTGNGKSKQALSGATVDCGAGGSATTGTDGRYTISSVPVGSHSCTASASGYRSKTATVSVSENQTTTADFNLR